MYQELSSHFTLFNLPQTFQGQGGANHPGTPHTRIFASVKPVTCSNKFQSVLWLKYNRSFFFRSSPVWVFLTGRQFPLNEDPGGPGSFHIVASSFPRCGFLGCSRHWHLAGKWESRCKRNIYFQTTLIESSTRHFPFYWITTLPLTFYWITSQSHLGTMGARKCSSWPGSHSPEQFYTMDGELELFVLERPLSCPFWSWGNWCIEKLATCLRSQWWSTPYFLETSRVLKITAYSGVFTLFIIMRTYC